MPRKKTPQPPPKSIRIQLIRILLIGLPLLFCLIATVVSIPLYQQIFHDEDESMQQFAQLMLNDRESQPSTPLSSSQSPSPQSLPSPSLPSQSFSQPFTNDVANNGNQIIEGTIFAETFQVAILDKSGNLLEDNLSKEDPVNSIQNSIESPIKPEFLADVDIQHIAQGFQNTNNIFSTNAYRLYVSTDSHTGETIIVAQPLKERLSTIIGFVTRQMFILLLSLPLLIMMVIWAVHKGLYPLNIMVKQVQQRHANDLLPISEHVPSELYPLAHSLNQLFVKVADGMDKQKRFTADASHELKTPITAIKVQAKELQHHLQQGITNQKNSQTSQINQTDTITPDYQDISLQAVQRIQKIADRSAHLIEQLLTLSKLDDDLQNNTMIKQPINWLAISEQALQSVSRTARNNAVKLQRHIPTKTAEAILPLADGGNQALLVLMLRNLLDNAIRYGSAHSTHTDVDKKVEITLTPHNISIRDYGQGIDTIHLECIRERFYRPAGQTQIGSGLGLSIVDNIAEMHGLAVDIYNLTEGVQVVITKKPSNTD